MSNYQAMALAIALVLSVMNSAVLTWAVLRVARAVASAAKRMREPDPPEMP